ncbi:MAG: hypothetical protein RIS56_433, partial [Verrucomicrobiota bacterium]
MGRGSVWERRVRLARREEEADPQQRSVTDKLRRQRAPPDFQTDSQSPSFGLTEGAGTPALPIHSCFPIYRSQFAMSQFTHVSNLWNDAEANALSGADRLVY